MKRVKVQDAKRLFNNGITIYLVPAVAESDEILPMGNYINKIQGLNFDKNVQKVKQEYLIKRKNYYVNLKEIEMKEKTYDNETFKYRINMDNKNNYLYCLGSLKRLGLIIEKVYNDDKNNKYEIIFISKFIPEKLVKKGQIDII